MGGWRITLISPWSTIVIFMNNILYMRKLVVLDDAVCVPMNNHRRPSDGLYIGMVLLLNPTSQILKNYCSFIYFGIYKGVNHVTT